MAADDMKAHLDLCDYYLKTCKYESVVTVHLLLAINEVKNAGVNKKNSDSNLRDVNANV